MFQGVNSFRRFVIEVNFKDEVSLKLKQNILLPNTSLSCNIPEPQNPRISCVNGSRTCEVNRASIFQPTLRLPAELAGRPLIYSEFYIPF